MSRLLFMRFPGGKKKALTLSYDDGVEQDIKLMSILDKYSVKCTFNLNSGCYSPEGKVYEAGQVHRRMSYNKVLEVYKNSVHEVASHSFDHPILTSLPTGLVAYETVKDRENLEKQFDRIVRGFAYPYGRFDDNVVQVLKDSGIVYARTTVSSEKFDMPKDWLRLEPTCHHNNKKLMELADKFLDMDVAYGPQMFYLWGHSYEFEQFDNWEVIENFCKKVSGNSSIWYATNIEIYEYEKAYNSLEFSVDGNIVRNPTNTKIYFMYNRKDYSVEPGETIRL